MNRPYRRWSAGPPAREGGQAPEFARPLDDVLKRRPRAGAIVAAPCPAAPPTSLLRLAPLDFAVFWSPPDGPTVVGLGAAHEILVRGVRRFEALGEAVERLWAATPAARADGSFAAPSIFGGFAFVPGAADEPPWTGFGDGCFVLPRWSHRTEGSRALLSLALTGAENEDDIADLRSELRAIAAMLTSAPAPGASARVRLDPAASPPDESFAALVAQAQRSIHDGAFAKVVLSRRRLVRGERPLDAVEVLDRLRVAHPDCCHFAFRPANGPTFLGATPEPLVVKRGLGVSSEALAGTRPRDVAAAGPDAAALAERLVGSVKDRAEHGLVVDGVREALSPFCTHVEAGPGPEVRALPNVLHLSTPIRGQLRGPTPLAALVAALHPTPATRGRPRERALAWLTAHEPAPRGWYAAPIGRIGADGDGEFCVAIRSALLSGAEAYVYAGAGIVADSDPGAEREEIAAKERTILAALEG